MAAKPLPSQEVLRQLLDYAPETGKLFWRERPLEMFNAGRRNIATTWNSRFAGQEAFTAEDSFGYKIGLIFRAGYRAHRVIFKMMTGVDPDEVDHIDGDRANNRWVNLREADRITNNRNVCRRRDNRSGVTGIYWDQSSAKWRATINDGGKQTRLGSFACFGAAVRARKASLAKHGYSLRHGTIGN